MSDNRPLFTSRYGITPDPQVWHEHWEYRHGKTHYAHSPSRCEQNLRFTCRCSGTFISLPSRFPCCARATGEDFRCDECRKWCYAVDADENKIPFPLIENRVSLNG